MDFEDWAEDLRLILRLKEITPEEKAQFRAWYDNGLSTNLAAELYAVWRKHFCGHLYDR